MGNEAAQPVDGYLPLGICPASCAQRPTGSATNVTSTIYDTDDSKTLIKKIVKEAGLDDKVYKANVVLNRISSAKNKLISWHAYRDNPAIRSEDETAAKPHMAKLYQTYVDALLSSQRYGFRRPAL